MEKFDLAISVVLHDTELSFIYAILASLFPSELNIRLIFIDHSKTDSLSAHIPKQENIIYIHNPDNPGYGAGHNVAISAYLDQSNFHLVLNPDVRFEPQSLTRMIKYMEQNPDIGLLSPKVVYEDGRIQRLCKLLPTPLDVFSRRFLGFLPATQRRTLLYELHSFSYDEILNVPYLSGCFMLLRTAALKECGFFDPRFFMYFEDTDLSRRIHVHYRTIFFPDATVVHAFNKASYRDLRMLAVHSCSAIRYFCKWGWFFDRERKNLNEACRDRVRRLNTQKQVPNSIPGTSGA